MSNKNVISSDFNLQRINTKDLAINIDATIKFGGNLFAVARRGSGKMIDLETDIPTPNGFVKLKDLKEGDQLFDENGNTCNITQLHPIDKNPESYIVSFDDGSTVNACADHLWLTWDKSARRSHAESSNPTKHPKVRTTKEILNTLKTKTKKIETNHSIPCAKPIQFSEKSLPIDPYVLGVWLGDGFKHGGYIETADNEILNEINKSGYIPEIYLRSSYEQRLALLQGLLDTDGSCDDNGSIEYTSVIPELAESVLQLIRSFGIKANIQINESWLYDKQCKNRHRITFTTSLPVFRLGHKLQNIVKEKSAQKNRSAHRYITDVKPIKPIPMRCITVDSPSHLFLITKSFIPTHNTTITRDVISKAGFKEVYFNLSLMERPDLGGYPNFFNTNKEKFISFLMPSIYRDLMEGDKPCVVVLDEVDKADSSLLAPLLELVQFRTVNGQKLKNLKASVMTGNLPGEGGRRPPLPLLDRAEKFLVEVNVQDWLAWGANSGEIHPSISAYIYDNPDDLVGEIDPGEAFADKSPRGWHYASKVIIFGEKNEWPTKLITDKVAGSIGNSTGIKYSAYYEHFHMIGPVVDKILEGEPVKEYDAFEPTKKIITCMTACTRLNNLLNETLQYNQENNVKVYKATAPIKEMTKNIAKFFSNPIVDEEMILIAIRSQINNNSILECDLIDDEYLGPIITNIFKKVRGE